MRWTGKIIGLILGAVLIGPLGGLIGFAIGYCYDQGMFDAWLDSMGLHRHRSVHTDVQKIFFDTTFTIMGYLAKSDGRISENEITIARKIMAQMGLNDAMKREAMRLFEAGKSPDFNYLQAIEKLKKTCWRQPNLLRFFLEIQIQIAHADGINFSAQKKQTFESICQQLGVFGFSFSQFEQQFRAGKNYQRHHQAHQEDPRRYLKEAYNLLEISPKATDAEVKKAYRRQMSEHHPDKLISKGVPPEMIKLATQKTQQIKEAYEQIVKSRGIK